MAFLFTLGSCLQDEGKRGLQILSYSIPIVHGCTFVILFKKFYSLLLYCSVIFVAICYHYFLFILVI